MRKYKNFFQSAFLGNVIKKYFNLQDTNCEAESGKCVKQVLDTLLKEKNYQRQRKLSNYINVLHQDRKINTVRKRNVK